MKKYLFISVKEEFTKRILDGTKQIELRKSKPNVLPGDNIIIYCTSPVKAIVGIAQIKEVIIHSPERMWRLHSGDLGIGKKDYDNYYNGSEKAIGIVLSNVKRLSYTICLNVIREQLPTFTPPQTYKYFVKFSSSEDDAGFRLVPC